MADFLVIIDDVTKQRMKKILSYLLIYGSTKEEDILSYIINEIKMPPNDGKELLQRMILYGFIEKITHDRLDPKSNYIQRATNISRTIRSELESISLSLGTLDSDFSPISLSFDKPDSEEAKLILDQAELVGDLKKKVDSAKYFHPSGSNPVKPYVGITGLVNSLEVEQVVNLFANNGFNFAGTHMPMIGVLISYLTIDLGCNPNNKRYPPLKDIPRILEATTNRTFNTIHFNTRRLETLQSDIEFLLNFESIYDKGFVHGFQLNIAWPSTNCVKEIKKKYPQLRIILQLRSQSIDNMSSIDIVEKIKEYDGIDYVLIDPSAGKGMNFDLAVSAEIFEAINRSNLNVKVGFAGGLSGDNISSVIWDLKNRLKTSKFCLDAEGNLRSKKNGEDELNIEKVRKYIEEAARSIQP